MAEKVAVFFKGVEDVWNAIPNWVKAFIYPLVSGIAALYFTDQLTFDTLLALVLANLGFNAVVKAPGAISRKLTE